MDTATNAASLGYLKGDTLRVELSLLHSTACDLARLSHANCKAPCCTAAHWQGKADAYARVLRALPHHRVADSDKENPTTQEIASLTWSEAFAELFILHSLRALTAWANAQMRKEQYNGD